MRSRIVLHGPPIAWYFRKLIRHRHSKALAGPPFTDVRRPPNGVTPAVNPSSSPADLRGRIGRIECLIDEIERFADPAAQDRTCCRVSIDEC
jgi:hypothetical protein